MNLRKRCEWLANDLVGTNYSVVEQLEAFAHEIRKEALEEAAEIDVYMTEREHGGLDLYDGERCFVAGANAYRDQLRTLALALRAGVNDE